MNFLFKSFMLALLFSIVYFSQENNTQNPQDLTSKIHPLGIAPNPQNGYGNGTNQLAQPDDVEYLKDGSILVSDVNNNRLQLYSNVGEFVKSINAEDMHLKGEITPTGLAQDAEGNIYISCEGAGVIVRLNPDLSFDQFIGKFCDIKDTEYYCPENDNCLIKPQGLAVSAKGDVFVIDMEKSFRRGYDGSIRNFGFRKFKKTVENGTTKYVYDRDFATTQEITKVMRKSEGMAINESKGILFIAEEKPLPTEFGNKEKYRYIAAFDLKTGKYQEKLFGVTFKDGKIVSGIFKNSVEGVAVFENLLFGVDEKAGNVKIFDIETGESKGFFGKAAYYYCDDESDCVIEGTNYNEQTIIAGTALPHLKNDWQKSELASPDGIIVTQLSDGKKRLAVVDQWNMRIVIYDLDQILNLID
ncbi:MAG: hypothetical protein ABFS12_13555 [Bacteroidota bacterium]